MLKSWLSHSQAKKRALLQFFPTIFWTSFFQIRWFSVRKLAVNQFYLWGTLCPGLSKDLTSLTKVCTCLVIQKRDSQNWNVDTHNFVIISEVQLWYHWVKIVMTIMSSDDDDLNLINFYYPIMANCWSYLKSVITWLDWGKD